MVKRRVMAAVLGTAAAAGMTMVASAPAQAVDRNCYDGNFCVYQAQEFNTNYPMYRFSGADANWSDQSAIYDNDSSWRNRWSVTVKVYALANYSTVNTCFNPGYQLGASGSSSQNNNGRSHKWDGTSWC
ncbi:peptidase inhibitor family I36 protein [Streptomyces sp. NBC_01353]|uniref:peptidase inhibitor family I36 protein n=1 Tax=Streptomyces sp. NBC_01353 TaxID=2903835 RepID=UPI002E340016|nr:peptidase inhibitor family I36 protein [Streptomyces sp. NBC_01353]